MTYRDFVPPIAFRAARRLFGHRRKPPLFTSYAEASKNCVGFGYEAEELVEVVYRKTLAYRDSLKSVHLPIGQSDALALFALGLVRGDNKPVTVLDFGGACGAHFYRIKALFCTELNLRWCVVETPAMVRKARSLQSESLSFCDSLSKAAEAIGNIDIVYSSGTLQCVPDAYGTLAELISCRGSYLVLPRLGLSEEPNDIVTCHEARLSDNGPGPMPHGLQDGVTRYPFVFPSRRRFEMQLAQDYQTILVSADGSGVFPVGGKRLTGLGYVLKRKA